MFSESFLWWGNQVDLNNRSGLYDGNSDSINEIHKAFWDTMSRIDCQAPSRIQ